MSNFNLTGAIDQLSFVRDQLNQIHAIAAMAADFMHNREPSIERSAFGAIATLAEDDRLLNGLEDELKRLQSAQ